MSEPARFDGEAIFAAMILDPGIYPRNRMPEFHERPEVKHARRRARALRSVARELRRHATQIEATELASCEQKGFRFRYRVPSLALTREVALTDFERACLVVLLGSNAAARCLRRADDDDTRVRAAVARLVPG